MAKLNANELSGDVLKAYNTIQKLKKSDNPMLQKKGAEAEKKLEALIDKQKAKAKAKAPAKSGSPKKATPKKVAKKKVAPKKKVSKPRKKTVQKKVPFTKRASDLMKKEKVTWAEAKKRVKSEIAKEKKEMMESAKTELQKLKKFTESKTFQNEINKFSSASNNTTDLQKDAGIQALPKGKRTSKSGKTYYEYRSNRSDVQTSSYPYLEAGGTLPTPFGQAGLVGETGAMNETDLFAMGGDLPQGVHQYYGQTHNPAYPTPHGYEKGGRFPTKEEQIQERLEREKGDSKYFFKVVNDKELKEVKDELIEDAKEHNKQADEHQTQAKKIDRIREMVIGLEKGGMMQGYNDRLDESLGNRDGVEPMMMQSFKDRRDESKGMEKAMGRRAYQSVGTMDKMAKGGIVRIAQYNDNENYDDFRNKDLRIVSVAYNTSDHQGYDEGMGGMALYDLEVAETGEEVPFSLYEYEVEEFAKGGKIGFDGLAKKVAKRYVGKPVPAKFREEYGKTYSKAEAMEVGKKVAGKVYREQQAMAHGGMMKQGYNAQLDESLGVRKGIEKSKKQSFKDRRDESKAMEKSMDRRAYSSVKAMDKGKRKLGHGGKIGYRE